MAFIEIYTKSYCPYSHRAKALLDAKGLKYSETDVTFDRLGQQEMIERSNRFTVPQIFIDGIHVGGYDDLAQLDNSGELALLVARNTHHKAA